MFTNIFSISNWTKNLFYIFKDLSTKMKLKCLFLIFALKVIPHINQQIKIADIPLCLEASNFDNVGDMHDKVVT